MAWLDVQSLRWALGFVALLAAVGPAQAQQGATTNMDGLTQRLIAAGKAEHDPWILLSAARLLADASDVDGALLSAVLDDVEGYAWGEPALEAAVARLRAAQAEEQALAHDGAVP